MVWSYLIFHIVEIQLECMTQREPDYGWIQLHRVSYLLKLLVNYPAW